MFQGFGKNILPLVSPPTQIICFTT